MHIKRTLHFSGEVQLSWKLKLAAVRVFINLKVKRGGEVGDLSPGEGGKGAKHLRLGENVALL